MLGKIKLIAVEDHLLDFFCFFNIVRFTPHLNDFRHTTCHIILLQISREFICYRLGNLSPPLEYCKIACQLCFTVCQQELRIAHGVQRQKVYLANGE